MSHVYEQIYKIVQKIPKGRVLTYGLISDLIGKRMSAQGVGWALKALGARKRNAKSARSDESTEELQNFDSDSVPWQRVVNSQGGTSTHKIATIPPGFQQHLLEIEGVVFNDEGKLDLDKYLWLEGVKSLSTSD